MPNERMPNVAFLPANIDGCALYRMFIPHLNIPNSRFVFKPGGVGYERFAEAEVVVVQRQVSELNHKAIMDLKNLGLKLIYDTDDNLWALQAANPHQKLFQQHQSGFAKCAMECHIITVTTKGLKSAVKTALPSYRGDILVVPNAMDFTLFQEAIARDDNRIIVGWAGSNTHAEDVRDAWRVLPAIMDEFPHVEMEFVGMLPPQSMLKYVPSRVRMRRFVPVGEFPSRFASWAWDITLAPLTDNRFNRSKSNIKMLEAAALNIPILVSPVQPYDEFCALHPDLRWLMCSTELQWKNKLRELIQDSELRKAKAQQIRSIALKYFDIKNIKDLWVHAIHKAAEA